MLILRIVIGFDERDRNRGSFLVPKKKGGYRRITPPPPDEAKRQRYRKWVVEEWQPYFNELLEKGLFKNTGWTDGTGTMYGLWEFEDMDAFAKVWNDEKFHRIGIRRNEVVDKIIIKLCRPAIFIPPKK